MVFIKWLLSCELVNGMVSDLCIFEVVLEALNKCQEKLWFAIILKQQEKYFFNCKLFVSSEMTAVFEVLFSSFLVLSLLR